MAMLGSQSCEVGPTGDNHYHYDSPHPPTQPLLSPLERIWLRYEGKGIEKSDREANLHILLRLRLSSDDEVDKKMLQYLEYLTR